MINKITIWLFLVFSLQLLYTQETEYKNVADSESVGKKLNSMAGKLNSIQAEFVQEKHMDFLQMAIQSKGKFWFQKENKLRWEYTEPYSYVIVINDGKISINDEGQSSEFKVKGNKIFQQVNDIIIASVKGEIMNDDRFSVELKENDRFYKVILLPRNDEMSSVIKEMHMYFDKESVAVSKIKMVEPNNDYTLIDFKNRKINEAIPAHIFNNP